MPTSLGTRRRPKNQHMPRSCWSLLCLLRIGRHPRCRRSTLSGNNFRHSRWTRLSLHLQHGSRLRLLQSKGVHRERGSFSASCVSAFSSRSMRSQSTNQRRSTTSRISAPALGQCSLSSRRQWGDGQEEERLGWQARGKSEGRPASFDEGEMAQSVLGMDGTTCLPPSMIMPRIGDDSFSPRVCRQVVM